MALKRFYNLEKRLNTNDNLREQYCAFMKEYIDLNHMRIVTNSITNQDEYFLPHHAVIKNDNLTTKLRVVFDGSPKSDNGLSLNDALYVGPVVQDDLFSILVRFRTYKYVITADINKMYRRILVDPQQTQFQRTLWRNNPNEEIKVYDLLTLTYGTACASYLTTKCLNKRAFIEKINFPIGSNVLSNDFYVDDLLTGANTLEMALIIRNELIAGSY